MNSTVTPPTNPKAPGAPANGPQQEGNDSQAMGFLLRNLLRGLGWLAVIVVAFVLARKYLNTEALEGLLQPFYDQPIIVFVIFLVSEIVVGIIPPELFFMWGLNLGSVSNYAGIVALLFAISYTAGIIGFHFGKRFNQTKYYRLMRRRFLHKYVGYLNRFGAFLVIVAAVTPLPYSGISMLVGAVGYPFRQYLLYSSFRLLRFIAYAWIIYQANML